MTNQNVENFQKFILNWHARYGRHDLPWRTNYDPYHILVSEVMLQQTQVGRVIPKFTNFLQLFPDFASLANASPSEIITAWQGLGYNRRGLFLQKTAQAIVANHQGSMPKTLPELLNLPGVGPYTASAIMAFAFNQPVTVIETNIRSIFLYHFFADGITDEIESKTAGSAKTDINHKISDSDLIPLITKTIYTKNPRLWYSALMDYGSYLKSVMPNPSRKSKQHVKQSKFVGSFRQLRGSILRSLTERDHSFLTLAESVPSIFDQNKVQLALDQLVKEGFISVRTTTAKKSESSSAIKTNHYSLKENHD